MQAQTLRKVGQTTKRAIYLWLAIGLIVVGVTGALSLLLAGAQADTARSSSTRVVEQELAYRLYRAGESRLSAPSQSASDAWTAYRAGERASYEVMRTTRPEGWTAYRVSERASYESPTR